MPDRDLVERIVRSSLFAKSPRLSDFLQFVCSLAEQGRFSDINEQIIGQTVFGRNPDYDPSVDSIVRSHASRLRHRLRDYFETEGADEQIILTIPKGSYIPRLEPRSSHPATASAPLPLVEPLTEMPSGNAALEVLATAVHNASPQQALAAQQKIRTLQVALVVAVTIAIAVSGVLLVGTYHQRAQKPPLMATDLLNTEGGKTVVVGADSSLVTLQHLTRRPVSLAAYTSHEYLRDLSSPMLSAEQLRKIAIRRYMPVIDNSIYEEVLNRLANKNRSVSFRYARDLRLEELKQGNAILLGSRESNPWVQLFEPSMNFYFQGNLETGMATMLNRNPRPGEQPRYDMSDDDSDHTVYGLIGYRPNLTKSGGHVLILEGQTMAGTQTASDFILDDPSLLAFLKKIRKTDGSIPHFELLLRSVSVGGESSRVETVAYRVSTD